MALRAIAKHGRNKRRRTPDRKIGVTGIPKHVHTKYAALRTIVGTQCDTLTYFSCFDARDGKRVEFAHRWRRLSVKHQFRDFVLKIGVQPPNLPACQCR